MGSAARSFSGGYPPAVWIRRSFGSGFKRRETNLHCPNRRGQTARCGMDRPGFGEGGSAFGGRRSPPNRGGYRKKTNDGRVAGPPGDGKAIPMRNGNGG